MTRDEFIGELDNWCSHRPALWDALQLTTGKVIELGVGQGSTERLHDLCLEANRNLESYDNSNEWLGEFSHFLSSLNHRFVNVTNWDDVNLDCSLLFIDHSPGERRKIDLERAAQIAEVIVIHDSEPSADHGYQIRDILKTFKYMRDYETPGAWTTMVSNFIPL
jgi:hypothetical protein